MRAVTSGPCRWFSIAVLIFMVALSMSTIPTSAWAQAVNTGNINGQVTDPQGAVVPGVKITVTDVNTGTNLTATTNAEGRYFIANVPPGTYNITASKSGFATAKVTSQTVSVGTTSNINLQMTVGEVSTTVEVQATNTELQTMNATIGNTVPTVAISSLPAIGLDVSTFATLQPGVSPDGSTAGTAVDQSTFMLDGGNNTNDMDGSMTVYTGGFGADPTGGVASGQTGNGGLPSGVVPTPADSVEEIKTNTTNQTADFNSSSGMQVQVVTKRGTNRWHGTAYEYYLDNNFSANSWQNNCTTACGKSYTPQADWHRSWFGVAGGGPLIPKEILGGKTYFFANYQGSRWPLSTTLTRNVPGPGMLQGLLEFKGQVFNLNPGPVTYTGPTIAGKCSKCLLVNGTTYPSSGLDPRNLGVNPTVLAMWNKYVPQLISSPGYNYGGGTGDGNVFAYTANGATPVSDNFGVARLDHDFGAKWHFFGSYRYYRLTSFQGSSQWDIGGFLPGDTVGVPAAKSAVPQVPWYYVAGLTTNITPTTTNDFHWSFTRNWWAWNRAGGPVQLAGLGGALEPGGESANALTPYNVNTQNTRTRYWDGLDNMFRDDITSLHGNHLLQFGGTYQRNHDKHQRTDNGGGINYYPVYQLASSSSSTNKSTANIPALLTSSTDINNYAREYNEVLGIVSISQVAFTRSGPNLSLNPPLTPAEDDSIIPFYNVYFSDSWHMKPSFTLTYGLGWTLEMPPVEKFGRQITAVDASGQPLDAVAYLNQRQKLALQGVPYNPAIGFALNTNVSGSPKYPYDPFYGSFSPRVAAAWNPDFGDGFVGRIFGGKSTVIRGGYGRIYGRLNGVDLVLVPLLGTGLIQPVQCFTPTIAGVCGAGDAATGFRIGTDGLTAPLAQASATLPQPDFPGISVCNATGTGDLCPEAGAGEGFDPHFRPNAVDSFTLSVQRQLGRRNTIELGYIGRLIHNEYLPLNVNAVPYMFTKGGQQFQAAYAAVEKAMGCTTSAAACGNATPGTTVVAPQPFFEAALSGTGYCTTDSKGNCTAPPCTPSCTAAVVANEFGNFQAQNVWDLWSDLDQNFPVTGNPGFNFGATMMNSPGAGGAPTCPTCPGAMLSSGVGLNASVGYGNYHAGFISWRMSNWHGFTSQSNLTWGKALGTGAVYQASSEYTADDPYDIGRMYGVQNFDRKLVFNTFFVYEPPFFKGQQGLLGRLLGGWNISPLFSASSGVPVYCSATLGGTESEAFGAGDGNNFFDNEQCYATGPLPRSGRYQGVVGSNGVADQTNPGVTGQFNAFKDPVAVYNNLRPAILGFDNGHDSGQGLFRGMPLWNLDLSVKKNLKISERFSTTFGAVFQNVLNHNQFNNPNIDLSNTGCLGVLSAACVTGPQYNTPRNIELGLRVNF